MRGETVSHTLLRLNLLQQLQPLQLFFNLPVTSFKTMWS